MLKVLVIGGGVSGLTTAMLLCQKGFEVTVIEKKKHCGGQFYSARTTDNHPTAHSVRIIDESTYVCFMNIVRQIPYKNTTVDKNLSKNPVRILYKKKLPLTNNLIILFFEKKVNFLHHQMRQLKSHFLLIKHSIDLISYLKFIFRFLWLSILPKKILLKHKTNSFTSKNPLFISIVSGVTGNPDPNDLAITDYFYTQMSVSNARSFTFNGPVSEKCVEPWVEYCKLLGVKFVNNTKLSDIKVNNSSMLIDKVELHDAYINQKLEINADEYVLAVPKFVAKKYRQYCIDFDDRDDVFPNLLVQFYLKDLPKAAHFQPGYGCMSIDLPGSYVFIVEGPPFWDKQLDLGKECKYVLSVSSGCPLDQAILYPHKRIIDCTAEELSEEFLAACQFTEKDLITAHHIDNDYYIVDEENLANYADAPIKIKRADGKYAIHFCPLDVLNPENIFPKNHTLLNNLTLAGVYTDNDYYVMTKERAARSGYLAAIRICEKYKINCDDLKKVIPDYNKANIFRRILSKFFK